MNSKKIFLFVLCVLTFAPLLASASPSIPYWGQGGLLSCNALVKKCTFCDLLETSQNIIYFMITLALFAVGPAMIAVGGGMMLISAGSSERLSSGRKMVTGTLIGIAISLGAFLIINTFLYFLNKGNSKVSWPDIQCEPGSQSAQPATCTQQEIESGNCSTNSAH